MDVITTCPLGSECESIKDNKLHRCHWYIKLAGITPQGDEVDEHRCSMAWLPLLQLETSQGMRGVASAVESTRNVQNLRQQEAVNAIKQLKG